MTALADSFWTTLPLGRGVQLVTVDPNGLAAFQKPAGVLSHPNDGKDEARSLLQSHYDRASECYQWVSEESGSPQRLWLLNRLDSATSGLLLASSNEALAKAVRAMFQQRHIKKVYNALVFGDASRAKPIWRDRLAVEKRAGQIRTASGGHIPAESHMRVLKTSRGARSLSLIELEPKTGRSHQLRVQCANRHLPIVGDATYGDFHANREFAKATKLKRMFLHSLATDFDYTFAGRTFHFAARADLPSEFLQLF